MTWIVFKTSFRRAWLWLKEYWQVPLLVMWTIIVYIFSRRNTDALVEVIEAKRDSYKKQLEVLRSSHNDEILIRERLTNEYELALEKVKADFDSRSATLSEKQKNEIKEVVVKSKGNPDEIKKRIEEEFGIKFI